MIDDWGRWMGWCMRLFDYVFIDCVSRIGNVLFVCCFSPMDWFLLHLIVTTAHLFIYLQHGKGAAVRTFSFGSLQSDACGTGNHLYCFTRNRKKPLEFVVACKIASRKWVRVIKCLKVPCSKWKTFKKVQKRCDESERWMCFCMMRWSSPTKIHLAFSWRHGSIAKMKTKQQTKPVRECNAMGHICLQTEIFNDNDKWTNCLKRTVLFLSLCLLIFVATVDGVVFTTLYNGVRWACLLQLCTNSHAQTHSLHEILSPSMNSTVMNCEHFRSPGSLTLFPYHTQSCILGSQ